MRYSIRSLALLGIFLISLSAAGPVLAAPPLPSSFYGTVKVNAADAPDGTRIQALINGQVYAEKATRTVEGVSMYLLNVPGDDPGTKEVEGGRDGDRVNFKIGESLTDQTGTWRSGTIEKINLTAPALATLAASQNQPTWIPGQTSAVIGIVLVVSILFIILWVIYKRRTKGLNNSDQKEMHK